MLSPRTRAHYSSSEHYRRGLEFERMTVGVRARFFSEIPTRKECARALTRRNYLLAIPLEQALLITYKFTPAFPLSHSSWPGIVTPDRQGATNSNSRPAFLWEQSAIDGENKCHKDPARPPS